MSKTPKNMEAIYHHRRQRVFLVLSGIFLGTLALLNVLGISRFLDMSFELFGFNIPVVVAVGVLPYPATFLCTDLISELGGKTLPWVTSDPAPTMLFLPT